MKECTVCNETKELDQFDRRSNANGDKVPTGRCKACRRKYIREYYSNKQGKTGLTREEWLNKVRKPKLSPEERQLAGKAKWDAWYAENKERIQTEYRKKAEQKREAMYAKGVKVCSTCKEEKPLSQYNIRTRKRKNHSYKVPYSSCKTCRNTSLKQYEKTTEGRTKKRKRSRMYDRRSRQATPKWLTKEHKQQIVDTYELMRDCRAITGEDYHVDHIVPLKGENICGLHVPWNLQVLPAYVNISKSNN
jgi:hypothetical protein